MASDSSQKLNSRQRKFVEVYDGNGTEAARLAGYSGDDATLRSIASENLTKPNIAEAIKARESKELAPLIATRAQRQNFWTQIMNSSEEIGYRLKASELLGRSQADFTLNIEHSGSIKTDALSDEELDLKIKKLIGEKK